MSPLATLGLSQILFRNSYTLPSILEILIAPTPLVDIESDQSGVDLLEWGLLHDCHLIHDSEQCGTFHSATWTQDHPPDLTWTTSTGNPPLQSISSVLKSFPHNQIHPIFTEVGVAIPVVSTNKTPHWNDQKANWPNFTQYHLYPAQHLSKKLTCGSQKPFRKLPPSQLPELAVILHSLPR